MKYPVLPRKETSLGPVAPLPAASPSWGAMDGSRRTMRVLRPESTSTRVMAPVAP